ncbi:MAG: tRNA 4-thiouridine(8) synthase ThiI [Lachnospiraceae bacterium]|nr:tRNA 4-thiouridine(8) synthase ThiI [Lachnospiraceae bacterium]
MKYQAFLIKYAEIAIKGKNRYLFEDALVHQITCALHRAEGVFKVYKTRGRIHVEAESEYDYEETLDILTKVFGITAICPVVVLEDEGVEGLRTKVVDYLGRVYPDRVSDRCGDQKFTFKVNTRRARKNFPLDSMEISASVGEAVLDAYSAMKVDVHAPELMINIEIREKIYLYSESVKGACGMPVGTGGKAMALLSGGIDSPVAAYMIAKRGVTIEAVYFHAPPYTSERAKQKVVDLAALVSKYAGNMKLHVVNFTDIQMMIYDKCPHDELTIIMRRYMMRIAEMIAKEEGCLSLVTGESIGQVASQTMQSLQVTNEVCTLPVFRPLIGFDKQEIVEVAERINTYETSILPYEDCCTIWVAKHPVTKPNLNIIKKHENHLKDEVDQLVKEALETREIIEIG